MKKKMSKKSRRWLKEFLDHVYEIDEERAEIASEFIKKNKKVIELLRPVKPWGELYMKSDAQILISFFHLIGMDHLLIALASSGKSVDVYQQLLNDLWYGEAGEEADHKIDEMSATERGEFFALLYALIGNMDGLRFYSCSVSAQVVRAQSEEPEVAKEAILEAVATDRVALSNSVIAKRIALAQISQDNGFMHELTKAITRTKPRRKHDLDDFRYMAEVVDELDGLENYSIDDFTDVCVNTLKVLPPDITTDAVKKNLQKRKAKKGK